MTQTPSTDAPPPIAKRDVKTTTQVDRTRTDPYHWLKDENWQAVMKDPSVLRDDIREYLVAENTYTKTVLEAPVETLKTELFKEMRGRIKEDDSTVPNISGDFAYYTRYRKGGEYPIIARRSAHEAFNTGATETILLDGDELSRDRPYFSFGTIARSPDHTLIAYAFDGQGSEVYQIRIRNVETGDDIGVAIDDAQGSFVWSETGDYIYWVKRDDNGRPAAIWQRDLKTGRDSLIYKEEDPGFFVGISKSDSKEIIFVTTNSHTTSEVHWFSADAKTPQLKTVATRITDNEYSVSHWNGAFYILTNLDGATDFKLMKSDLASTSRDGWANVIPHRPGTLLLGLQPQKDYLARMERTEGLPRIVIRGLSGEEHDISFDEAAYDLDLSSGYDYETPILRFGYASPATPDQVYDYDLTTHERTLRKTREVPSGHEASDYVVERLMAPAHDGEEIPITLLRHKETAVDGSAPLLLYGYGSYGITIDADFRTGRLSLVDRGMIYVIAHVRGGMAKGYQWYLDGRLKTKENTFKDFVSVGRYLIERGYTKEGQIIAHGGSAGGLLMGAVVNMAPELFGGIIAAVPFVDVINTMSDESLPLTPPEWPEWGNPIISADDYDTIIAYSPYDNVSDQSYPPMIITGGLSDPRVTYWEPAKWAAKLRHDAPQGGPYFLRINMDAGHGGASGRFEGLKEAALEYAFALNAAGQANDISF